MGKGVIGLTSLLNKDNMIDMETWSSPPNVSGTNIHLLGKHPEFWAYKCIVSVSFLRGVCTQKMRTPGEIKPSLTSCQNKLERGTRDNLNCFISAQTCQSPPWDRYMCCNAARMRMRRDSAGLQKMKRNTFSFLNNFLYQRMRRRCKNVDIFVQESQIVKRSSCCHTGYWRKTWCIEARVKTWWEAPGLREEQTFLGHLMLQWGVIEPLDVHNIKVWHAKGIECALSRNISALICCSFLGPR